MTAIAGTTPSYVISYNGITFGPLIRTKINGTPVYDRANRVVTHISYVLHIHGWIHSTTLNDQQTAMAALHSALLAPGGNLVIEDLGFGSDVATGAGSTFPDVLWGAKPRVLEWQTFGHIAAEVVWVVEFNLTKCGPTTDSWLAFNYSADYETDEQGLSTRVLSGYAQVPAVRQANSGRSLLFSVDAKWDKIVAHVPAGFRRVRSSRRINEAKNQLEFSFVDAQLPGEPYPPGIVETDLGYSFSNVTQRNFIQYVGSLSGSLTVAPGVAPSVAGAVFFSILQGKIATLRASAVAGTVLPLRLSASHRMFSRTTSFSVSFGLTTCLQEILSSSGLWKPVGTTWEQWATSMLNVWASRGTAGLRFNPNDDKLIDACVAYPVANIGRDLSSAGILNVDFSYVLQCQVTEANSYLSYLNQVQGVAEETAVIHKFAQAYTPETPPTSMADDVIQYQGSPDFYVVMHGESRRVKFKPEVPRLISVGGVPATFLSEEISIPDTPVTSVFDCPVYEGQWSRLYKLSSEPPNSSMAYARPRPGPCGEIQ